MQTIIFKTFFYYSKASIIFFKNIALPSFIVMHFQTTFLDQNYLRLLRMKIGEIKEFMDWANLRE